MDLETENRIAAILMKEAAELRREAEKEGVLAYQKQPTVRGRPNSRFLTATVLGLQQANKAVEVNEMWRARQKELELDNRKSRDENRNSRPNHRDTVSTPRNTSKRYGDYDDNGGASCSSSKGLHVEHYNDEDEGLKEEEVEEFLQSRVKRGRGSVGSRMDETGPYLPSREDADEKISSNPDAWAQRVVLGPEKPFPLESCGSVKVEYEERLKKKAKKDHSERRRSHKHRSKDKSRDEKRKKNSRDGRKEKDGKRHRE